MERWNGKVAIVTGASTGIGKAIATKLVEEGMIVAGLARRKEKLEQLAESLKNKKGVLHPLVTDMTKEEDILKAFEYVTKNLGPIHVLVNNAGIARHAPVMCGRTDYWRQVLDTNVLGLAIASREAVQNMLVNKVDGHIIQISSIAGRLSIKEPISMDSASKRAVASLNESLKIELARAQSKIKVSSISPGYVDTEIINIFAETSDSPYVKQGLANFKECNPYLTPEDLAECVIYMLGTPPHVQVFDVIMRPVGETL